MSKGISFSIVASSVLIIATAQAAPGDGPYLPSQHGQAVESAFINVDSPGNSVYCRIGVYEHGSNNVVRRGYVEFSGISRSEDPTESAEGRLLTPVSNRAALRELQAIANQVVLVQGITVRRPTLDDGMIGKIVGFQVHSSNQVRGVYNENSAHEGVMSMRLNAWMAASQGSILSAEAPNTVVNRRATQLIYQICDDARLAYNRQYSRNPVTSLHPLPGN